MASARTDRKHSAIAWALLFILGFSATTTLPRVAFAATHTVTIAGFAFSPPALTIANGDTVIWNNTDPVIYTLWFVRVSDSSTYLLSDPIPPGSTWSYTFTEDVELLYFDLYRLWVSGSLSVTSVLRDVAVTNLVANKNVVCQGYPARISVTVENQGSMTETFDVTVNLLGFAQIGLMNVALLAPSEVRTVTFTWDTTGVVKGNYTLQAVAAPVPGEVDIADNVFVDGWIMVSWVGDLNGDGVVDIFDIVIVALAFGSTFSGDPNWNPVADINGDGIIDIFDIVIVALHFGEIDP